MLLNLYLSFFKIGLFTFGGGYAMIPLLIREVVEKHKWCSEEELMDYYALSQVTPGVIAVNVGTFIGNKMAGVIGGIIATLGVVTPSMIIIIIISSFISNFGDLPVVKHALNGIQIAVCILMTVSIGKLFKNGVKDSIQFIFAGISFICAYFFGVSAVILVVVAVILGLVAKNLGGIKHE